jgi:hypothetical protein
VLPRRRYTALRAAEPLGSKIGAFVGIHAPFHDRDAGAITTTRAHGIDLCRKLRAPARLHFGGKDGDTPPADVAEVRTVARDVAKTLETHAYPLAEHGFALFTDDACRRADSLQVHTGSGAFLRRHLPRD